MSEQSEKRNRLKQIFRHWDHNQTVTRATRKTLHLLKEVPQLSKRYEQLQNLIQRFQQLRQNYTSLLQIREVKEKYSHRVLAMESVMIWSAEKLPELEQHLARYHRLTEVLEKYRQNQKSLSMGHDYLQQRIQNIEEISQEYMELLKLSGRCPTCGSPISASLLEHLEQELCGGGKYAAVGRADESGERKIGKAKNMRYKAEARLETLEREEKQILQELAELNVEPHQLEEEIQRLEKQITEEMDRIWEFVPAELKE